MPQRLTALLYSLLITLFATGTAVGADAKDVTVATNQESPVETLCQKLDTTIKAALSSCAKDTSEADSIAIALLDTLNVLADEVYDLYNSDTSLHGEKKSGITPAFKERLEQCAIVSVVADSVTIFNLEQCAIVSAVADSVRIFKGSPAQVYEKCKPYLSEAGQAFFTTRMRDQLQPCFYDDMLILMRWDSLAARIQMWDSFCIKHEKSYAGRVGNRYSRRYLSVYLTGNRDPFGQDWGEGIQLLPNMRFEVDSNAFTRKSTSGLVNNYRKIMKDNRYPNQKLDSLFTAHRLQRPYFMNYGPITTTLLEPGVSYGDEQVTGSKILNDKWLSLEVDSTNTWWLNPVQLQFKKCESDGPANEEMIYNCITPPNRGSKYLLSSSVITAGRVNVIFSDEDVRSFYEYQSDDPAKTVRLLHKQYVISNSIQTFQGNRLVFLMYNGNVRYLFQMGGEKFTGIRWMGDIDFDGKLDLIVDASPDMYGHTMWLLLSKFAISGELLRRDAYIHSIGHYRLNMFDEKTSAQGEE